MEDHIEMVMLPESGKNMLQSLIQLKKLTRAFEKIGFANDAYLGNLTTSPKNLGTGMHLQCKFGTVNKSEEDCAAIEKAYACKAYFHNDVYVLESGQTLSANYTET